MSRTEREETSSGSLVREAPAVGVGRSGGSATAPHSETVGAGGGGTGADGAAGTPEQAGPEQGRAGRRAGGVGSSVVGLTVWDGVA